MAEGKQHAVGLGLMAMSTAEMCVARRDRGVKAWEASPLNHAGVLGGKVPR